uniref:RdRp n=1 Tax=viral metagenome TaxID=1070528 RepID=A0A2V0RMG2_9ZZZZ
MWHVQKGGMWYEGFEPPPALGIICDFVRDELTPYRHLKPTPRGTNHGWPDLSSSDLSLLMHASIAASSRNWEEVKDNAAECSVILGQREVGPFSFLFTRTGPNKKPVNFWETDGDSYRVAGHTISTFCRTRLVHGLSTWYNLYQRGPSTDVKGRLVTGLPSREYNALNLTFEHRGADFDRNSLMTIMERVTNWWKGKGPFRLTLKEQDFSGYDLHVAWEYQMMVNERLYSHVFREWGLDSASYVEQSTIGVVGPPIRPGSVGYVYPRKGQTMSGSIFTTTDGCLIALSVAVSAISAGYGISESEGWKWYLDGAFGLLAWGDDVLMVLNEAQFDVDAYLARVAELGFKVTFSSGHTFLMVWHGRTRSFNLAGRSAMQTLFREHGTLDRDIALLGFVARFTASQGDPLWQDAIMAATESNWLGQWAQRFSYAQRYVQEPAFIARVQRALKADVKQASRLLSSLTRGERDPSINLRMAPFLSKVFDTKLMFASSTLMDESRGAPPKHWARRLLLEENPLGTR